MSRPLHIAGTPFLITLCGADVDRTRWVTVDRAREATCLKCTKIWSTRQESRR